MPHHRATFKSGVCMNIEETLNAEQRRAIESPSSIILVNAGAGSGKTAVLTLRLIRLLKEGVSPCNILALTFTRHAAGEMRRRIEAEVGVQKKLTLSTFHAFAASLLERWGEKLGYRKNFSIYDAADQAEIVREILEEQGLPADPIKVAREMQLGRLDRNDLISLEYQRRLKERNAVDYQGLLTSALTLLRDYPEVQEASRGRFTHLLVDENQNTDPLQWAMIEALHPLHLFMTGDDYQSIYQFRGAKVDHILSFPKRFPEGEVIRLEQNYRSTLPVVEAANRLISYNRHQLEKKLWTYSEGSVAVSVLEADSPEKEAETGAQTIRKGLMKEGAHPGGMASLYRTHLQAIPLARALQAKKIPCQVITHSFWEKEEVRHFMALLTILHNTGDDTRLKRILPPETYSPEILSGLNLEAAEADRPLFEILPDSSFKEHLLDLQEKLSRGDY